MAVGVPRRAPGPHRVDDPAIGWPRYATSDSSFQTRAFRPAYRIRSPVCVRWLLPSPLYQRRGLRLGELHPGAVAASRASLKPEIPRCGNHGIPIRDELILEKLL